jgi:DtxR family Mn-dependent transcriptional regulator
MLRVPLRRPAAGPLVISSDRDCGAPAIASGEKGGPLTAHGLIDTTEMYLRTVFELEEEGIVPLRARIAERLSQSGPTVSQTVARMERDGLLRVEGDRQLSLTVAGRALAVGVMRKHRLAECLLVGVIGLPWEEVHIEACRWEHVISEQVERRLVELLDYPVRCPHGNVIPGLDELGVPADAKQRGLAAEREQAVAMTEVASERPERVIVRRISEQVQSDAALMLKLKRSGIQPGREVTLALNDDGVQVTSEDKAGGITAELPRLVAAHVFVTRL